MSVFICVLYARDIFLCLCVVVCGRGLLCTIFSGCVRVGACDHRFVLLCLILSDYLRFVFARACVLPLMCVPVCSCVYELARLSMCMYVFVSVCLCVSYPCMCLLISFL